MISEPRHRVLLAFALALPTGALALPSQEAEAPSRYVRQVEEDDGGLVRLELAARHFTKEGAPDVVLVAAMHVGEEAYYGALQSFLDPLDVVLFEGVGEDVPLAADAGDEERVAVTEARLRFLAIALERHHAATQRWPERIEVLAHTVPTRDLRRLSYAILDGWGNPVEYRPRPAGSEPAFELGSLGADGVRGGEGAAADFDFADQEGLERDELEPEEGIQAMLADALGLVFQLDVMDTSGENWRNSDLSLPALQERLVEAGVEAGDLFGAMRGESFLTKLVGGMLKLLGSTETGAAAMKLVGIEVLSRADELFEAAPGEMGALLEVLIQDRNAVVVEDLRTILASEPDVRTVGVLYGAGHLADLEHRLQGELGYAPGEERWFTGVTLKVDDLGLPRRYVKSLRDMIRSNLDRSLRALRGEPR